MTAGPDRRGFLGGVLATTSIGALNGCARTEQPDPATLIAPGIGSTLATHRARQIGDLRYDLSFDLTHEHLARGTVAIGFDRQPASGDLILDFRGPGIDRLSINGRPRPVPPRTNGHIVLPAAALTDGANRIDARFTTPIAAADAAIIRFADPDDGRIYLYTLLVPSDANLLFPCFDQPDLKARFRWTIVAPAGWRVVTNGAAETHAAGGKVERWRFAQTKPISTYLAAFAAGPWAQWASAPPGQQPITLFARASRREEVDVDVQIAANRAAATWLAEWFGVPFPFDKLDLVLAPAFPFGGMEHVGAVFYNEDRFVFREPPTLTQRLGRDQTIYHEISHQWFGDLVTMRWFDDLWLKEGFATYMAARVQAELQPDSNAWQTFFLSIKTAAYRADATSGTAPLWQALDNLDAAKSNYGPIVYYKAPAVIKQLAFLVGEHDFRQGIHLFLTRHAYGNATWRDLLAAVAERSGTSLDTFGKHYMLRAGMPRIDTGLRIEDGRIADLSLSQRPVRALAGDPGGYWPMKTRVRLGYRDRPDVVLDARFHGGTAAVPGAVGRPAPDYVWANDGDHGYGLFMPDPRSIRWIAANVTTIADPLLRAMLWNALWDVVRDVRMEPGRYLSIVFEHLPDETDEQIARTVLSRAASALTRYLPDRVAETIRPRWETMLLDRSDDRRLGYGPRKDALDLLIATARGPAGLAALRDWLAEKRAFDGKPIRQPTRWRAIGRLLAVGASDADAAFEAERARDRSTEAAKDAFVTRAASADPAVKDDYFRRYFDDPDLNEAWVSESLGGFNTLDQAATTRRFLRPALDRLPWIRGHRRIFFLPSWIEAFIGGQRDAEALAIVDRYLADTPRLPIDIRRKLLLARDELERTVAIRDGAASSASTRAA